MNRLASIILCLIIFLLTSPQSYATDLDGLVSSLKDGGYVIVFPDLSGCLTQADDFEEINAMAEEARRLWIETEYEIGADIPLPTQQED